MLDLHVTHENVTLHFIQHAKEFFHCDAVHQHVRPADMLPHSHRYPLASAVVADSQE